MAESTYSSKLLEWVQSSTSHGIPNIFRHKNYIVKVVWTLAVLAAIGYCLYFIITSLINYQKHETTVNTELLREVPSIFPAVTICNLQTFDYSNNKPFFNQFFDENNIYFAQYLLDPDFDQYFIQENEIDNVKQFPSTLKRLIALETSIDDEQRKRLGFSLKERMLLSCSYNKIACTADDFEPIWSDNYGTCYTFNGLNRGNCKESLRQTSRIGFDYGLELELLVGDPSSYSEISSEKGILLLVHNNSVSPFVSSRIIKIPVGFSTYVPFTRTYTELLPAPYSDCITDLKPFSDYSRKLFGFMKEMNATQYSSEFCYSLCYQDKLIDKCKCSDISHPRIRNSKVCNSDSELECLSGLNNVFSSSNIKELCDNACPIECNSMIYNIMDHKSTFPTNYYYTELVIRSTMNMDKLEITPYKTIGTILSKNNFADTLARLSDNIVKLTVNYDDLRYTHINEVPLITIDTLFGVLGGQLGLFIGISFLSFIELFELAIIMLTMWWRKRKSTAQTVQLNLPTGWSFYNSNFVNSAR